MPRKQTREEFIEKAKIIHGNKYDYSQVVYVNSLTNVKILCKECGNIFKQRPGDHINKKYGCPKCGRKHVGKVLADLQKKTTE